MTAFQLVALPLLVLFMIATGVATARHRLTVRAGVLWIVLWTAAAVSIAHPETLVTIARFLGIGRGTDLVLYLSILFMFVAMFLIYLRFRRMDEQITMLVRHIAIREGLADDSYPSSAERVD
jgi:small membrane protein